MSALYDKGREKILNADIDWLVDSIKAVLVKTTYSVNLSTHEFLTDLGANTSGSAVTLTTKSSTAGVAGCDDIVFTSVASATAIGFIVIYHDTGVAATSPLIAYIDSAGGIGLPFTLASSVNVTFVIDTGANKLFKL